MKQSDSSLKELAFVALWTGFWTAVGGGIATGLWLLTKAYIPALAAKLIRVAFHLLPTQKGLLTLSHALYWICIPMLVIPFSYVFIRENRYVSQMYEKRDALEAGTLKPGDLTLEERYFIESHWPELFKP
ncbi:MAG: hypothetical protein ACLPYZ_04825 [Limisphaerales bacterium]